MRRLSVTMLVLMGAVVLVGGGLVRGGPAGANDASSSAIVGSWRLLGEGPSGTPSEDPALATFAPDGTLVLSSRAVRPALPGMPFAYMHFSTGNGTWEENEDGTIAYTVVRLRSDETGIFRGTSTFSGRLELGGDGRTIAGEWTSTVRDPTGIVVGIHGSATGGERIAVEGSVPPCRRLRRAPPREGLAGPEDDDVAAAGEGRGWDRLGTASPRMSEVRS